MIYFKNLRDADKIAKAITGKSTMSRIRFTPWKDPSELLSLRDQFYPSPSSPAPDMRKKACSLVSVWKLRGNLPQAVEATALITEAVLHDDPKQHSIYSIQATYSTAFCRFVTALVDRSVHGRRKTMYHLAAEVGIPASFVELRHEATHRDMPSLVTLQRASQRALKWLWQYYWVGIEDQGLSTTAPNGVDVSLPQEDVRFTKRDVRQLVEPVVRTASGSPLSVKESRAFERESALPIASQLAKMCRGYDAVLLVAQVLLEEGVMAGHPESIDSSMDVVFSTWDLVLLPLSRQQTMFLTTFVEDAVKILVSSSVSKEAPNPYQTGVFSWLERIVGSPGTWAATRKQYLVLSYVRATCGERNGYWADRLRPLLGDLWLRIERSPEHQGGDNAASGLATGSKGEVCSTNPSNPEENTDIAALRDYGWGISEMRSSKPIGVI